jgi:ribA/ribD-fused uncharacterized protein
MPKEDCDRKVTDILKEIVPAFDNRTLTKAYRLGPFKAGQIRPIICCFHHVKDKLKVIEKRSQLQAMNIFVNDDFTKEVDEARDILRPSFLAAKRLNMDAKLHGNRLIVSGKVYCVDDLQKLPKPLLKENIYTPQQHNITAFFTQNSPLSNHYLSSFTFKDTQFNCMEQYIMAMKASLFEDHETYLRVIQESNPKKQKQLGKNILNYNHKKWLETADGIIIQGLKEKFGQSDYLKKFLLDTGNSLIVEASLDKLWGVGIHLRDSNLWDATKHVGQNKMGKLLMNIRAELRK